MDELEAYLTQDAAGDVAAAVKAVKRLFAAELEPDSASAFLEAAEELLEELDDSQVILGG